MANDALAGMPEFEEGEEALFDAFMNDEEEAISPEPAGMDDDELKTVIEAEIREAIGYDDDLVSSARASALDYYTNAPRGDEKTGRSKVQSSDVADAVEWTLPELVRLFSDPASCTFRPKGPGREDEADQHTKAVRQEVYGDAGSTLLFYQWFKDALLQRNGLIKVYWSDKVTVRADTYTGLTEPEMQSLVDDPNLASADVAERQVEMPTPPEQAQQIMMQAQQQGIPNPLIPPTVMQTVYDVQAIRHIPANSVVFDPVPPEEFLVNEDHKSVLLDDARFICHRRNIRRSDLVAMGYDKDVVDGLPAWTSHEQFDEEEHARSRLQETWSSQTGSQNSDPSADDIECHECYVLVDYDGDGIAERRRVFMAGDEILSNDYWTSQPFAALCPFVMPHRFFGTGLFDRLREIQDIKTTLLRQWLDNMYLSNNGRTEAVTGQVNLDDLLTSRPGGVVRVKAPGMLREIVQPQIGDAVMQALAYQDKVRGERSGVNPDQKSEGMDIAGDTAHGLERLMTAKEELLWMVGKLFAETGVRQLFLKTRDELAHNRPDPMDIEEGDSWIRVDPSRWTGETNCIVKTGAAVGERQRKIGALVQMHGIQMQLMANPATQTLVNHKGIYGLLEDIQRLGDIDPDQAYFVDPEGQDGMMAAQQAMQSQQQMMQIQQQMQQMQMQLQQALAQAEMQKSQAAMAQAETKRLEAELAALEKTGKLGIEREKMATQEAQALDRLEFDYTKLEVEQNTDVPGHGMEGKPNGGGNAQTGE